MGSHALLLALPPHSDSIPCVWADGGVRDFEHTWGLVLPGLVNWFASWAAAYTECKVKAEVDSGDAQSVVGS